MALKCVSCTKTPSNRGYIHIHVSRGGENGYTGDSFCCLDHLMFWLTSERAAHVQKRVDEFNGKEDDDG